MVNTLYIMPCVQLTACLYTEQLCGTLSWTASSCTLSLLSCPESGFWRRFLFGALEAPWAMISPISFQFEVITDQDALKVPSKSPLDSPESGQDRRHGVAVPQLSSGDERGFMVAKTGMPSALHSHLGTCGQICHLTCVVLNQPIVFQLHSNIVQKAHEADAIPLSCVGSCASRH